MGPTGFQALHPKSLSATSAARLDLSIVWRDKTLILVFIRFSTIRYDTRHKSNGVTVAHTTVDEVTSQIIQPHNVEPRFPRTRNAQTRFLHLLSKLLCGKLDSGYH